MAKRPRMPSIGRVYRLCAILILMLTATPFTEPFRSFDLDAGRDVVVPVGAHHRDGDFSELSAEWVRPRLSFCLLPSPLVVAATVLKAEQAVTLVPTPVGDSLATRCPVLRL